MEVILAKKTTLSKLVRPVKIFPQVLLNVKVADKEKAENDKDVTDAVKKIEKKLKSGGRILVRSSGTEPLIRVMVEAENKQVCEEYAEEVASVLRANGHITD